MNFGHLKSKIEHHLLESYTKGNFKEEMKKFKSKVLENKKISKVYHLYDELNENKNLSESTAREFINECILIYDKINLSKKDLTSILEWVSSVKIGNKYEDIDMLFSKNILNLENKVFVKESILNKLTSKKEIVENNINLPLSTMVNVANKTFSNYISNLDEPEKKELMEVLQMSETELKEYFLKLQENTIQKLNGLLSCENDFETKNKLNETIEKVKKENIDRISFFRLKKLNETI